MSRSLHRLHRYAPIAAVLALALPAPASAASLGTDQRCYVQGETATITGSGFAAGSPVAITQAGTPLAPATSDASGSIRSRFTVPAVAAGLEESQLEVTAGDGIVTARTIVNLVRAGASFAPESGNPRTMKVRHVVAGFGLALARPSVYLHYVSPMAQKNEGKAGGTSPGRTSGGSAGLPPNPPGVRSIRIGLLRGPCGVLRTSPRKLFPFKPAAGRWLLQYDTNPRYTRGAASSSFYWVRKVVTVKG